MMQQTDLHSSSASPSSTTQQQNLSASEEARQSLEGQLGEVLQTLFELSVVVYDFQPGGNKLVWNKINTIVEHYQKMDELKDLLDASVPEEVIHFVEQGRNPDIFTQGFIERAASENQFTNGKIRAMEDFRTLVSSEFKKSFPDLYDAPDIFGEQIDPSDTAKNT